MFRSRDRIIQSHMRSRFVVTLKSGAAFEGLLIDADDRSLVLCDSLAHVPDGAPVRVDGQLFVGREDVAYMQLAVVSAAVISR